MEPFRLYVFPALLLLGAAVLMRVESRTLRADRAAGHPRWTRFFRRLAGALTISAVAAMLHFGRSTPPPHVDPGYVERESWYWLTVLALVMFAMLLALWDVMDGIRALKRHVEAVERDEMEKLRQQLGVKTEA